MLMNSKERPQALNNCREQVEKNDVKMLSIKKSDFINIASMLNIILNIILM